MRKLSVLLAVVVIVMTATSVFAQRIVVDKAKVNELTKKISECQSKIDKINIELLSLADYSADIKKSQLEIDSLNKADPQTSYGQNVKKQALNQKNEEMQNLLKKQVEFNSVSYKKVELDSLSSKIKRYENEKTRLFEGYIVDNSVPKELTPREKNRRERGLKIRRADRIETNQARREELGFEKLAASPVKVDSITGGYEGFIWNLSTHSRVTFKVFSVDDYGKVSSVQKISLFTSPGERKTYYLLPGEYYCVVSIGGSKIGDWSFDVTPQLNYVLGEWTHWEVHREGY